MFKNVLVFAAHPDDEIIGCGGLLCKLANQGSNISVAIVTGGSTGVSPSFTHLKDIASARKKESEISKSILGISQLTLLGHRTQEVTNDVETFHQFIKLIRQTKPDLVLTHSTHDKHRDHRVISDISREAVWKAWENIMTEELGPRHRVKETWHYEVLDPFQDVDILIDISDVMDKKLEAIRAHHTQIEVIPGIEGLIEGLGKARAFILETRYAEGYQVCNILPREL
jgi:LmbE family N-acetylglucosaminyl deacetylase